MSSLWNSSRAPASVALPTAPKGQLHGSTYGYLRGVCRIAAHPYRANKPSRIVQPVHAEQSSSRERDVNMQLDRLKEETKLAYADAIDRVKAAAAASHGHDGGSQSQSQDSSSLQHRLQEAIRELSHGLIEREVEVRLLLLAALSQEHLLLLGPPGTAKSELGRRYVAKVN